MNKHGGIIEIRGIKGIITAIFALCCIATGFTVFPGFVAMHIWNLFTPYITDMPQMTLIHGIMLWAILFLIWFAFNGKPLSLHFGCDATMSEEEIKELMEKVNTSEKAEQIEQIEKKEEVEKEE